tara:strand:+ start:5020 stop:6786 length:1767 start_codon:yes stop_codon:yes gene_type:complete
VLVSQEQLQPVQYPGHAYIVAVPGSGKTRTIVAKTTAMVKAGYSNIGIISFTNASAVELQERLEKELSKELVEKHIAVATFHSMMLNHVRQHVVGTGLVSTNYETTHMLSVLKKYGIPAHHLDDFRQFSNDHGEIQDGPFYEAWIEYTNQVIERQHITLSNVVTVATEMIIQGRIPPLPFSYIFVDEYQDCDTDQIKMLLVHGLSGVTIVGCGDDDQSIYSFRKARGVDAFRALQNKLGAREFILSTNYRSHSEITDFANALISRNKIRIDKTIHSHKGVGGCVTLTMYNTAYEEAEDVSQRVAQLTETAGGEIYIIARSNAALDAVRDTLTVPFIDMASKGKEPYESQVMKTGLSAIESGNGHQLAIMLSLFLTENTATSVASTVCGNRGQQSTLLEHTQPLQHVKHLMQKGQTDAAITEFFAYSLPHMLSTCEQKKGDQQAIAKSKSRMQNAITRTEQILHKLKGTVKQRLEILSRQRKETGDARVKVMTAHGSKGLEAETVFLIGVAHKKFPASKAESEARARGSKHYNAMMEEERRLLYVAATRAMKDLHISAYMGTSTKPCSHGYSKLIPPAYIDELPSLLEK